ncbi:MAG: peptidase M64 [Bacteroidales bacterium]|nr:peptidase M64 [Bacteroidales bacterium]
MNRHHILLWAALTLLSFSHLEAQNVRFSKWFTDATLRLNYLRTGTRAADTIYERGFDFIPTWSGSLTQLIDPFDNGAYRVSLRDSATGALLYSRCYNSLFHEYRDTPQGDSVSASFEEVVRLPWPKKTAYIFFERRGDDNRFHPQDSSLFNPQKALEVHRLRSTLLSGPKPLKLLYNGDVHKKIDVVIVPEGYGPADTLKMRRDLNTYCDYLLSQEPFRSRRKDFNVWGIPLTGKESGITDPNKGLFVESLVGASFNTFGSDRYLMTEKLFQLHNAIGWVPCDHIIIMANTDKYGGGGIYNFYAMSSLHPMAPMVLPHELGHSIGGLADEYVDEDLSYGDCHPLEHEPPEPNITSLVDFGSKWASMLPKGVPVPTPADASVPRGECGPLGVYEGAGYRPKGLYRPTMHCMMRDFAPFCPVCLKRMNEIFDLYTK